MLLPDRALILGERITLSNLLSNPDVRLTNDQISFTVGAIHALDWLLGVRGQLASEFLIECKISNQATHATSRIGS